MNGGYFLESKDPKEGPMTSTTLCLLGTIRAPEKASLGGASGLLQDLVFLLSIWTTQLLTASPDQVPNSGLGMLYP